MGFNLSGKHDQEEYNLRWKSAFAVKPKPQNKMRGFFGFFSRMFGSNPKRRGRTVAFTALLAFNAPQDALKFEEIRNELSDFLRTGLRADKYAIIRFSNQAAVKLNVNPLAFRVLVSSLIEQTQSENGDRNARLFIEGIVEALDMLTIQ